MNNWFSIDVDTYIISGRRHWDELNDTEKNA